MTVRVDGLRHSGVGHLVRQLALAEELMERGHRVVLAGVSDVPWAQGQVAAHGLTLQPVPPEPSACADALVKLGAEVVIIDGYDYGPALGQAIRAVGLPILAMVDDTFGLDQIADVYVDQNLGAPAKLPVHAPSGAQFLSGPSYVLLRDVVLRHGGAWQPTGDDIPRILVVFGGTDPFGGCETLVPLIVAAGHPVEVVAVAARPEVVEALQAIPVGTNQHITVVPPQDDLPGLALTCDAAISAAGTSVYEFACLGVPTGLVCVTDNQLLGYHAATAEVALAVGELTALRHSEPARTEAIATLSRLLTDASLRSQLSESGRRVVDGRGRVRVADAVEALVWGA